MKTKLRFLAPYLLGIALFLLTAVITVYGVITAGSVNQREQTEALTNSIRRAVVTCYAMEGAYPESLDYLIEKYNINYDQTKFAVHYSVFADNFMPDFDVLPIADGEIS